MRVSWYTCFQAEWGDENETGGGGGVVVVVVVVGGGGGGGGGGEGEEMKGSNGQNKVSYLY